MSRLCSMFDYLDLEADEVRKAAQIIAGYREADVVVAPTCDCLIGDQVGQLRDVVKLRNFAMHLFDLHGLCFEQYGKLEGWPLFLLAVVLVHHDAFVRDHPCDHVVIRSIKDALRKCDLSFAQFEGWAEEVRKDHASRAASSCPTLTADGGVLPIVSALTSQISAMQKQVSIWLVLTSRHEWFPLM
jgi:hypothetical protein